MGFGSFYTLEPETLLGEGVNFGVSQTDLWGKNHQKLGGYTVNFFLPFALRRATTRRPVGVA